MRVFLQSAIFAILTLVALLFGTELADAQEPESQDVIQRLRQMWQGQRSAIVSADFTMRLYRYPAARIAVLTREDLLKSLSVLQAEDLNQGIERLRDTLPLFDNKPEWPIWGLTIRVWQE